MSHDGAVTHIVSGVACDATGAAFAGVRASRNVATGDVLLHVPLVWCMTARDMAATVVGAAAARARARR